jgi:hypothetical protein
MTRDVDIIPVEVVLVSVPPVLHPLLFFKSGENKNDGNLLLAKPFVE